MTPDAKDATPPVSERRSPGRRSHPLRLLITLLIGVPVVALLVWPQAFGAQQAIVLAQSIAFRAPLALTLGVGAVVAGVIALFARRWGIAAGIAIVLAVAAAGNTAVLVSRGSDSALPEGDLTVLAWNTQGGATPPDEVARLILTTGADIVSLPEMDDHAAAEVARIVTAQGYPMTAHTTRGETGDSWIPTSLLLSEDLGAYRHDETAGSTPGLPSGVWRPVEGDGPTIVAAHPLPPLPGNMDEWRAGLRWVADRCDSADVIVAGDLNATVDHLSGLGAGDALVGGCRDAATEARTAAAGTWPSTVPSWLASPIDHVLVGSAWSVRGVRVITSIDEGTDHRPIVAVLDAR